MKACAISSTHHQPPTRGDNTVSVAQGGTATPGATKQLLPLDRVFKRIYIYIYILVRSIKSRDYIVHWEKYASNYFPSPAQDKFLNFFFIIQHVKVCAISSTHLQPPTRGDNTVSVAQGGTATPGTTKQLLPLDRVFKRIYIYMSDQLKAEITLYIGKSMHPNILTAFLDK